MPPTEDLYHLGIKALIRNPAGQILLLKVNPAHLKGNRPAYWDIPGGRVQRGHSLEATLRREVEEETGLTQITTIESFAMVLSNIRIPLEPHDVGLILAVYNCQVPDSSDIKLSFEHTGYAWFSPAQAANLLKIKYPPEFTEKLSKSKTSPA